MIKRNRIGIQGGIIGIVANLLLFISKLLIGMISGSMAIAADAVNNLSDFLSAIITVIGFKVSSKPADRDHPFGHERFEFISGLLISLVMIYLGIDLLLSSVAKITNPTHTQVSGLLFGVIVLSIIIKGGLVIYYQYAYRKIDSEVLKANAQDSRNDILISVALMISFVFEMITGITVDGVMSLLISVLIIYSSITMIAQFVSDLLGRRPDRKDIAEIKELLDQETQILGFHDLIIHNYGKYNRYASVHVDLDARMELVDGHKIVDAIERKVMEQLTIDLVVHLDPVEVDNPHIMELNAIVASVLGAIDPNLSYHDLQLLDGTLMFDVVVGDDVNYTDDQLAELITAMVNSDINSYVIEMTIDRNYL